MREPKTWKGFFRLWGQTIWYLGCTVLAIFAIVWFAAFLVTNVGQWGLGILIFLLVTFVLAAIVYSDPYA